nr:ester cyclase [Cognatishimia sp. MH4019]
MREAGGRWCACITHYIGNFTKPLFGLAPSHRMAWLRSGEFYRIEDGQIVEAKIIFDLPDLMVQAGTMPLPSLGTELTFPAPATQDGLLPSKGDGAASLAVVEAMLSDLHVYDPETFGSEGQTGANGVWADDMLWYGPAGIGSNFQWSGFVKDHREPFLRAFPDRKGGNHYCRFGDGDYAAISGWPSMTMTHQGAYLGVPATGKAMTLRVMDFYRIAGGQIAENWVTLDYGDLFHQMGVDLIERSNAMGKQGVPRT